MDNTDNQVGQTTAEKIDLSRYETLSKYSSPLKMAERDIIGREKEIDALLACGRRPELSNAILLAPAGCGKAIVDTELIAVNDDRGYISIGEVCIGDEVFDENGQPTKVLGVYPQGELDAYEVEFTNGMSVVCNDEHIWNVRNKWGHRQGYDFVSKTLRELIDEGVRRKVTKKSNGKSSYETRWYVPVASAVERDVVKLPLDPYVVGVLIGDGCLTKQQGDALVVSSNDEYVVNKVASILNCECKKTSEKNYNWVFKDVVSGKNIRIPELLSDTVFKDSLLYKKSIEKFIPSVYLRGSIEQRMALLNGLMDTDGCVPMGYRCNVSFSTSSERLFSDVCQLASSLGFLVSTRQYCRQDKTHTNVEYEIHFCVDNSVKKSLFTSPRQLEKIQINLDLRENVTTHKHYGDVGIKSVTKLDKKLSMTCIYVDSLSHLFQVGKSHIVTHNTSLVQQLMKVDSDNAYLEVDVSRMVAENGADTLGATLKLLFDDVARCVKETNNQIVLFIDEFHKIINVSESAVEDLKPLLADSGTRGIRVIAATTLEEFNQYISQNQPLVERLQRINVPEPNEKMTVAILRGMAERYGVGHELPDNHLFRLIYDYTNRYVPANSQPRKSLTVFDAMLGWHKYKNRPLDEKLLADVIMESEDVNIAFSVDADTIKEKLDKKIISQEYATWQIADRLQLCVAGLNDPTKPQSTFLFSGASGVGKATRSNEVVPSIVNGQATLTQVKDLCAGKDYVFNAQGKPVKVLGVFPQGKRDLYRVTFVDGRYLDVSDNHLWGVYVNKKSQDEGLTVYSTKTLMNKGVVNVSDNGCESIKYKIPMNKAVQWDEVDLEVDPYVVGAFIGNGCFTEKSVTISSDDEFVVDKIAKLTGAVGYIRCSEKNYSWVFDSGEKFGSMIKRLQTVDVFSSVNELIGKKAHEKFIPNKYKFLSIEQRWSLIQGLFDADGTIVKGTHYNVSYSSASKRLVEDIQWVLYSLGISSNIAKHSREGKSDSYHLYVRIDNQNKYKFFSLPRKLERCGKAKEFDKQKQRHKKFDYLGIKSIVKLNEQEDCTCIYVDDEDHLYQAGNFIVTHNTEVCKQLSQILFGDKRRLIRFDMTEYANADSLERFRDLLTTRVWEHPYSIVLLDEIEKACSEVTRLLLQVLDDGRLNNRHNREVSFVNAYIIMTTNAGSEIYKTVNNYITNDYSGDTQDKEKQQAAWVRKYDHLIRESLISTAGDNKFPPELLGRIDAIVPFNPLSMETKRTIVKMRLEELQRNIQAKHGVVVGFKYDDVLVYLVDDHISNETDAGGAREAISVLERDVTTKIARFINENPTEKRIAVKVDDPSKMAYNDKGRITSEANIVVFACPK